MANPAEIDFAVPARMEHLQSTLAKAEAAVKNSAVKMQKDIGKGVDVNSALGKGVDLGGALGMAMKGAAVMKISTALLDGMKLGVDAFNQGSGAKQIAGSVVKGFYDGIKAIPIAGQAASLVEALFYGAEQEAERRALELAEKTAAALEKGAARLEAKAATTKGIRRSAGQMLSLAGADDEQANRLQRNFRLHEIREQIDEEERTLANARKAAESKNEATRSIGIAEAALAKRTIEALELQFEAEKATADAKYDSIVASKRAEEQAKREAKAKEDAQNAEKKRLDDIAKKEQAMRDAAEASIAAKQAELNALQAITPVDRQTQMMQSAQSSASAMMGSVSTALGEFKFAQQGTGALALAEAKKQTDKAIKIEQLQADMKMIQQEMLKEVKALNVGVS